MVHRPRLGLPGLGDGDDWPEQTTNCGGLQFQLFSDLVAVLNEQRLTYIEIVQKLVGFRYVVAMEGQVRNPLLLLGYVSFALGDMSLGFLQMANLGRQMSKLHVSLRFLCRRERDRSLSHRRLRTEPLGR